MKKNHTKYPRKYGLEKEIAKAIEQVERMKNLNDSFKILMNLHWVDYSKSIGIENPGEMLVKIIDQFASNRRDSALSHTIFYKSIKEIYIASQELKNYNDLHGEFPSALIPYIEQDIDSEIRKLKEVRTKNGRDSIYKSISDKLNKINWEFVKWATRETESSKDGKISIINFEPTIKLSLADELKPILFDDLIGSGAMDFYRFETFLKTVSQYYKETERV